MKHSLFYIKRILGAVIGFMLFYAPFDGFARLIDLWITPTQLYSIHEPCFRIPLNTLLTGDMLKAGPVSLIAMALLLVVSLIFGPLYCGKLCPAGALPEWLSRLVPKRFQIDWPNHVRVTPIRYGFLAGFFITPVVGMVEHCSYCNFFVFDMLVTFLYSGRMPLYSVSLIATFALWFVLLGLFTRGGRGFCNFLCPVGAFSSLVYSLGRRGPISFRMKVSQDTCIGCRKCHSVCPMRTIEVSGKATINTSRCIVCGACKEMCPTKAISYGRSRKDADHE